MGIEALSRGAKSAVFVDEWKNACALVRENLKLTRLTDQAKVINLTTNITSLTIFLLNGQVIFLLGIAAALCNMAGNYVGSSLAMTRGSRITRPVIILVLFLLLLKVLGVI